MKYLRMQDSQQGREKQESEIDLIVYRRLQ